MSNFSISHSVFKRLEHQTHRNKGLFGKGLINALWQGFYNISKLYRTQSMIDWIVFYAAFNSISVISRRQLTLFVSFLGFTSTRLGSEVSCPRTLPWKNPEDPVRLEPRTPGLRVKHFTTESRGTPNPVKLRSIRKLTWKRLMLFVHFLSV